MLMATVPLRMAFDEMVSFCSIGFIVVMIVLAGLCVCTSLIGKFFAALEKKQ